MTFSGHRPRKRFGQHWLVDRTVLDRIVEAADLQETDRVLEVGPGRGALTERLLASPAASVLAVELDRDLVAGLRTRFGADPRFSLIQADILALPLPPPGQPSANKVVANIPYTITGPLLEKLVGRLGRPVAFPYQRLVLLVQQEVGQRIRADPGSSAYSALSVRMQLLARCRPVVSVPARCFSPPPRVTSEVIVLDPLPPRERLAGERAVDVERLLAHGFASRRKMLRNGLAGLLPAGSMAAIAEAAGIDLSQRPQELAPQAWINLATAWSQERLRGQAEST